MRRRFAEAWVSPGSLAPCNQTGTRGEHPVLAQRRSRNSGLSSNRRLSPPTNSTPNSSAISRSCHAAPA
jgi:hypothetical protein